MRKTVEELIPGGEARYLERGIALKEGRESMLAELEAWNEADEHMSQHAIRAFIARKRKS